jgi:hypothetical protein
MAHCGTCRHWEHDPKIDRPREGSCDLAFSGDDERFKAHYGKGDDGVGDLTTRDDFGCIAHSPGRFDPDA